MAASSSVQLNVRLDPDIKDRGDSILDMMGYSPAEAVRAVWGAAAAGGGLLDDLKSLLERGSSAYQANRVGRTDQALAAARDEAVEHAAGLYEEALHSVGIMTVPPANEGDDAELLRDALWERLCERGLA